MSGANVMLTPPNLNLPTSNFKLFKKLLSSKNGKIYDDGIIQVKYRSVFKQSKGKIACQMSSKAPLSLSKVEVISQAGAILKKTKESRKKHPEFFLFVDNLKHFADFAKIQLMYRVNAQQKILNLTLPVFIHHFISPFKIDWNKYNSIYKEYSSNPQVFKLDEFIRNPNSNAPVNDIMTKFRQLFEKVMNLNVKVFPDERNIKFVFGVGIVNASEHKTKKIPVVIELQKFDSDHKHLRLGIRAKYSPFVVQNIFQIIQFFVSS